MQDRRTLARRIGADVFPQHASAVECRFNPRLHRFDAQCSSRFAASSFCRHVDGADVVVCDSCHQFLCLCVTAGAEWKFFIWYGVRAGRLCLAAMAHHDNVSRSIGTLRRGSIGDDWRERSDHHQENRSRSSAHVESRCIPSWSIALDRCVNCVRSTLKITGPRLSAGGLSVRFVRQRRPADLSAATRTRISHAFHPAESRVLVISLAARRTTMAGNAALAQAVRLVRPSGRRERGTTARARRFSRRLSHR
jgi:hypothetical protein